MRLVQRFRFHLSKFDREGVDTRAGILESTRANLAKLATLLLEPVAAHLEGRRLVIAPHGVLHHLPFHALPWGDGWVADRFEEQGGGIRPWLFKILHNVFYTRLAKSKRAPVSVEELHGAATDEPGPDEPSPAWNMGHLDWEHVDERLKGAIEHLRPQYRTVLLLWAVEGLKYREIARIQDIPIGTVMSRLHRARSILADQLTDLAEETGQDRGRNGQQESASDPGRGSIWHGWGPHLE